MINDNNTIHIYPFYSIYYLIERMIQNDCIKSVCFYGCVSLILSNVENQFYRNEYSVLTLI